MEPVGRPGVDVAGLVFCVIAFGWGLFRVITGEHTDGQVPGGLLMLTTGLLGVNAGLRVRARVRARRSERERSSEP